MSKVKFIQIGRDDLDASLYREELESVLASEPGALIFGTYWDATKNTIAQEIWANSKKYNVDAGSDAKIYEGATTPEVYVETAQITPRHGDYYIQISDLNPAEGQDVDADTGLHVERRTAYIFDATIVNDENVVVGGWIVLDGNVSADNVYFPNGIRHNQEWGAEPAVSTSKVDCIGYNLTNVMKFFLLRSDDVPEVQKYPNIAEDPIVTVSSEDSITYTIYKDAVGQVAATSGEWLEVGTKLYIPTGTVIIYNGYNLNLTSSDSSVREGGASMDGMIYGYWTSAEDASTGRQDLVVDSSVIQGEATYADFVHDDMQTDGLCRLIMNVSGVAYSKPSSVEDSIETLQPSVDTTLSLPTSDDRVFTVQEGTDGTITFVGTNGNKWKANRSAYTIPAVGPVWVANNEYDKNREESYGPISGTALDIYSAARSGKSETFVVKGYYPVYSNIKQQTYTSTTYEINNATKNSYSWSLPTLWSSSGLDERPVYIEYPKSKSITLTVGGVSKTYTPTEITKTVGGVSVAYYRIAISAAYAAGQIIAFSLT